MHHRLQSAFIAAVFLIVSLSAGDCRAGVELQGLVPPGIDKWDIQAQYARIYRALAPDRKQDPSTLVIRYFSRKTEPSAARSLPEWGGGGAVGADLIIIPVDADPFLNQSFYQITVHELVHIVLNRAYRNVKIPRWFHEGLAMLLSGELSFQEEMVISRGLFTNSTLELGSIDSVNATSRFRAEFAYAESHQALLFLVERYGLEAVPRILGAARKEGEFWKGFGDVIAVTPREFETLVRNELTSKYRLAFFLGDTYAIWLVILGLAAAAFAATMARNRRRLRAMAAAEALVVIGQPPGPDPPESGVPPETEAPDDRAGQ